MHILWYRRIENVRHTDVGHLWLFRTTNVEGLYVVFEIDPDNFRYYTHHDGSKCRTFETFPWIFLNWVSTLSTSHNTTLRTSTHNSFGTSHSDTSRGTRTVCFNKKKEEPEIRTLPSSLNLLQTLCKPQKKGDRTS